MLIEYVHIPGVNDAPQHADQLCDDLRPLTCTMNVIPYNPRRNSPSPAPTDERVQQFVDRIHARGQFVKHRQSLGRSDMAACGQLGNATIRGWRVVVATERPVFGCDLREAASGTDKKENPRPFGRGCQVHQTNSLPHITVQRG